MIRNSTQTNPTFRPQNRNGKEACTQIDKVLRNIGTVNRMNSSSVHSATLTENSRNF